MPISPCIRPSKQDGTDTISIKIPEAGDAINALKDSKGGHHESTGNDFMKGQSKTEQVLIQELASLKKRLRTIEGFFSLSCEV
jgi:hypothetical protein